MLDIGNGVHHIKQVVDQIKKFLFVFLITHFWDLENSHKHKRELIVNFLVSDMDLLQKPRVRVLFKTVANLLRDDLGRNLIVLTHDHKRGFRFHLLLTKLQIFGV